MAESHTGREAELAAIAAFLDGGSLRALVLEGEAGIGKTTLWREGLRLAEERDYRVLACAAASAEAHLPFSALADLLGPVLESVLDELPGPRRRALEIALLLRDPEGPPQDELAVG